MKKNKILLVGLIGLLLAGGLILAGCAEECNHTCIVAFDENGNRFNFSSYKCGASSCTSKCNVEKNWSNGSRYKEVKCDC